MEMVLFITLVIGTLAALSACLISASSRYDVSDHEHAKVRPISDTGKTAVYTDSSLSERGDATRGSEEDACVDNATTEMSLCDIGKTDGRWWAYVSYLDGEERIYAYIPLGMLSFSEVPFEEKVADSDDGFAAQNDMAA